MRLLNLIAFFAILCSFAGCTVERAEEQILARHVNGVKKTSIWVYPDGTVLKRNEWYNDGIKELEIPYKDNVPHGEFKRWTGFGDVAMIGHYKKGLRDGKWTSYYVERLNSRKKEAERFYKEDHPVGDWEGWHYDGSRAFEEHYDRDGRAVGIWKMWYDNGALRQEGNCHAKWDANRQIESAEIGPDGAKSYLKRYSKDCGLLEEFTCERGHLSGEFALYYESLDDKIDSAKCGKGRVRIRGTLGRNSTGTDSALIGTVTYYRADGTSLKQEYWNKDGKRDSVWRWFDEAGNLLRESDLSNGGIIYGACDGHNDKFCAETSFIGDIGGILANSNLDQSANFEQSIGKFPATVRYFKPGHQLMYEEFWQDGKISESRSFYPDSMGAKLASEAFWKVDPKDGLSKRNGIMRNWYASGVLRDSLSYVNGERVGEQFSFDSTGKLTIHKTEAGKNRPVIMHLLGEK